MQKFPCCVSDRRLNGLTHSSVAQGSREDGWGQIVSMYIRSSICSMHSQAEFHV